MTLRRGLHLSVHLSVHLSALLQLSLRLQGRAERAARRPARDPRAKQRGQAGRDDGRRARRGGRKHPTDAHRCRTGSSALAPRGARRAAAHALPRAPPIPGGRRYARRALPRRNGHPPDAPALSRPRSPSRALAMLASFGWRCPPLWTVILRRYSDRACRKDGQDRAPGQRNPRGPRPIPAAHIPRRLT
jgi:hypothetical protein